MLFSNSRLPKPMISSSATRLLTNDCGPAMRSAVPATARARMRRPSARSASRYPIESLEEALGEGIMSGHPDMPEFAFDADDVGAIIAYLKSIQQR